MQEPKEKIVPRGRFMLVLMQVPLRLYRNVCVGSRSSARYMPCTSATVRLLRAKYRNLDYVPVVVSQPISSQAVFN